MSDFNDPFTKRLLRLQGLAGAFYNRIKAILGWCDFGPEDILSETWVRVLELTEPGAEDGVRIIKKTGRPVDDGFLVLVMKYVLKEMVRKSTRLNRQMEPSESERSEAQSPIETVEDKAPLQDEKLEIEEQRRLVLEYCDKKHNDPCFNEIMRKVLYEGYSFNDALNKTAIERGLDPGSIKATYYRRFSRMLSWDGSLKPGKEWKK